MELRRVCILGNLTFLGVMVGSCLAVCPPARHLGDLNGFALSPDAKKIAAVAEDGTLVWWDATTGKRTELLECIRSALGETPIVFSPDSSSLAVAVDASVYVFELPGGKITARLTEPTAREILHIVFSGDGRRLAARHDRGVTVWNLATQGALLSIPQRTSDFALSLNSDGSLVAATGHGGIALWAVDSGRVVRTIPLADAQFPEALLFIGDGTIVSALARGNGRVKRGLVQFDREIDIWDAATGKRIRVLEGEGVEARFPLASAGHTLFAFDYNDTMRSWDLDTGRLALKAQMPASRVSGDGRILLHHGPSRGEVELWRIGQPDDKTQSFVYQSPLCTAVQGSDEKSRPPVEDMEFELLSMGSGVANDGTMIGFKGFVRGDCIRLNTTHGEFRSEDAADKELREEVKQFEMIPNVTIAQEPRAAFGLVFGQRALVRVPATRFSPQRVELLLTDRKHFYALSSESLDLVLAIEKKYYQSQGK